MADDEDYEADDMEADDYAEEDQMDDIELEQAEDDGERIQLIEVNFVKFKDFFNTSCLTYDLCVSIINHIMTYFLKFI